MAFMYSEIDNCKTMDECKEKHADDEVCDLFMPTADVVPRAEVAREIDDLRRDIILNEDIALKCKRENGEKNEEYWKGKLSAFKQIRMYIDAELKKKYTGDKQRKEDEG
jgi:hypothetical protein